MTVRLKLSPPRQEAAQMSWRAEICREAGQVGGRGPGGRRGNRVGRPAFQLPEDEPDLSDREPELDDSAALSDLRWRDTSADSVLSPQPSSNPSLSLAQPLRSERSGRDTPASVDSIPLEWDHDYDLSRDLESAASRTLPSEDEERQEDKDFYLQGAVGLSGRKELYLYIGLKGSTKEYILYWKYVS